MTMQKKKKIKRVSQPDAMKKKWKPIIQNDDAMTLSGKIRPTSAYSMGQLYISFSPEFQGMPAILQVSHPNRLPKWDELVWIRYKVCPDIEDMACILPPLDDYINYSDGRPKYTMTMEDISLRRSMRQRGKQ